MERNIMKRIIMVACLGMSCMAGAFTLENDPIFKKLIADCEQLNWVVTLPPGSMPAQQFVQSMGNNIKKAVFEVVGVTQDFIHPANQNETFTQYIAKCGNVAQVLFQYVVDPLHKELAVYPVGGPEYQVIAQTSKVVDDLYKKLNDLKKLLEDHWKSPDKKNATALAKKMQEFSEKVLVPMFATLDTELAVMQNLLVNNFPAGSMTETAQDIVDLRKLLANVKTVTAKQVGDKAKTLMAILNVIRQRLLKV